MSLKYQRYSEGSDSLLSMIHVAMKLRSDVSCQKNYEGVNATKEDA